MFTFAWFATLNEAFDKLDRTGGQGSIFEGFYLFITALIFAISGFVVWLKKEL
jgi:hypothetical protein